VLYFYYLPIEWILGALSLGLNWPEHEADHSHPSNAGVKNAWSGTMSPPSHTFTWCGA